MFFCTDVHYDDEAGSARAAAVGFWRSTDDAPSRLIVEDVAGVAPYVPGEFYRRELPCLQAVLAKAALTEAIDLVIVDGHAWLQDGRPGLGHHLWEALDRRIPVFGVAKAPFVDGSAIAVVRGGSLRPLYVSAVGVDVERAVDFVRTMHGENRLPTMLRAADALCRGLEDV